MTKENRSILLLEEIKVEQTGAYTCRAENVAGSVTSTATVNMVEVTEWEKAIEQTYPQFVHKLSPVKVMDGESVNFTCVVDAKPTPKVEWFHNRKLLKEGKQITILQDTEGVCSLAISEVFPEDEGEYVCRATNVLGETVCATSLIVEGVIYFQ